MAFLHPFNNARWCASIRSATTSDTTASYADAGQNETRDPATSDRDELRVQQRDSAQGRGLIVAVAPAARRSVALPGDVVTGGLNGQKEGSAKESTAACSVLIFDQ